MKSVILNKKTGNETKKTLCRKCHRELKISLLLQLVRKQPNVETLYGCAVYLWIMLHATMKHGQTTLHLGVNIRRNTELD